MYELKNKTIFFFKNQIQNIIFPSHVGRSPVFLTTEYFIRPNEIVRTKWTNLSSNQPFCSNDLMISSEH